jgi:hypothetical protein
VYRFLRSFDGRPLPRPESLLELLELAERKTEPLEGAFAGGEVDRTLPGGDFIARTTWEDVLGPHGWEVDSEVNGVIRWTRPGKGQGVSATTGYVGEDALYVFSSNADPFQAEKTYTRFGAYALLEHEGDFSAAAAELRRQGFGRPDPDSERFTAHVGAAPADESIDAERSYCPIGLILVHQSRRVRAVVVECDRWACPNCGARRAEVVAAHAGAAAPDGLYAAELTEADWKAATRAAQRQGIERLSVRRAGGGALLVTTAPLQARSFAWSLSRVDAADLLPLLLARRIRRVDWSAGWRPEPKPAGGGRGGDEVVARITCGPKRIDQVLVDSGVVESGRATVHAAAAAARIWTVVHGRRRPSEHFHTHSA